MDDLHDPDSDILEDDSLFEYEPESKPKKEHARQRYDRLMEDRRLAEQMEDDLLYWQ